jgi:class 3 adenylate cyclase
MKAVHRYESTVNQVMGVGIMALFGAPVAQEDHAARACYAALACRTRCGDTRTISAGRRASLEHGAHPYQAQAMRHQGALVASGGEFPC